MPQHIANVALTAACAGLISWLLTGLYRRAMIASRRLEAPNARSMHATPVAVGAGIAIVSVALGMWPLARGPLDGFQLLLAVALAGLAAMSWADDRYGLSPLVRLAAQVLAISMVLTALGPEVHVLPGGAAGSRADFRWASAGCGSSTSSISWTASTASRAARRSRWPLGYLAIALPCRLAGPVWRADADHRRRHLRATWCGTGIQRACCMGDCRLDPARLSAGLADDRPGDRPGIWPRRSSCRSISWPTPP